MILRFACFLLLLGTGRCVGQVGDPVGGRLQVAISSGYELESFHWSIAGNSAGQDPNIYSELRWRDVGGFFAKADILWAVSKRWRLMAMGSRTWTCSGSMTDTDYGLDNRNDVVYHQQFPVTGGYSEAGLAGVGYVFFGAGPFELTPYAGYSITKQYFPVTDPGGPYSTLNSSYAGKWLGPFLRLEGSWRVARRWRVTGAVRYDQVVYRGVADWNLIAEFRHPVSFRHRADGYGVMGDVSVSYAMGRHWAVSLTGDPFYWDTGMGIDALYLANGSVSQTQLNQVVRKGFGVGLRTGYHF
ncbi:MAG TPA: hypothetical protein VG605_11155 [Puia sp.]|nr:hypothetical protein [Puia sp.]